MLPGPISRPLPKHLQELAALFIPFEDDNYNYNYNFMVSLRSAAGDAANCTYMPTS